MAYLEELRRKEVCQTRSAANQHGRGEIEICDAFWPYERRPRQQKPPGMADYTEQIRRLLASQSCVKNSFTPADEKLAAALFQRQVPIEVVEHGILLGCARKYLTLLNGQNSASIVSLSYFEDVIEEAAESEVPNEYWRYLRYRVDGFEKQWLQKLPPNDDRRLTR